MKKYYRNIGFIAVVILSLTANATPFMVDGVYYEKDVDDSKNVIVVSSPDGYSKDIYNISPTIEYDGKTYYVTAIDEKAFYWSPIKTIHLPQTIKTIGKEAFRMCQELTFINLPEGISEINEYTFYGCTKLGSVDFPSSLTSIGTSAFDGSGITGLTITSEISYIGKDAFANCKSLTSIIVEEGNQTYDSRNNCNAIIDKNNVLVVGCKGTINVPESVTGIGEKAFYRSPIKTIHLPQTIKTIGKEAFRMCQELTSINLPEGISEINEYTFYGCTKLGSVDFPSSLTSIGTSAFDGSGITDLAITSEISFIGKDAFANCKSLTSIIVEEGNQTYDSRNNCNAIIDKNNVLVVGCKGTINVPESVTGIGEKAFYWSPIKTIHLPQTLRTIGKEAFRMCQELTTINLPEGVNEINEYAFYGCTNLIEIISHLETPFIINDNVFYDYNNLIYSSATLFVPIGKVEIYKSISGWKNFLNIREIEPDPTPMINGLTFIIHKQSKYAEIKSTSFIDHIVIPASVEYENVQYPVTSLLDSAFIGHDVISLSIPNTIKSLGKDILKDCHQLAAIVWNPPFKPSDEFVSHIENPNLLFYVTQELYKPSGVRNVIVDNEKPDIILTDESIGNFYCPKAFTAKRINYTHRYSLKTEKGVSEGWESIALPFDVTEYTTEQGNAIKPYASAQNGERLFWLKELTNEGMHDATGIKANIPYLISMPNWEGYQDYYNITGDVTFSAENVEVPVTNIVPVSWQGRHFTPCFQKLTNYNSYAVINKEFKVEGTYPPGSIFICDHRDILPFEAYIKYDTTSTVKYISIAELCDNSTAIQELPLQQEGIHVENGTIYMETLTNSICRIYRLNGQLMKLLTLQKGQNCINNLESGIYLINGKKIIVQ